MLLTLESAQTFKADVTQEELDGLEATVRGITNNKFQNVRIRYSKFEVKDEKKLVFLNKPAFLRPGDTIEISQSDVNDGLFVIESLEDNSIILKDCQLFDGIFKDGFITKIEYPKDILVGVQKLLKYSDKMGGKVGIKSESISRMSIQYYDVNAGDNVEGFPSALFSFLNKYKKLDWGDGGAQPNIPNPFSRHIYNERGFGNVPY
ncbi:hypothetical protein [Lactococcus formosensis]|uniref:hypothetical protein n=1 Tax=Lactococcus formosensis TaxID=1281486 RepID=UPI00254D0A11|nr:hypothetical protein [Lactococcus formosensis]